MSLKRIMLYVLTGFCMGAITLAMLEKMGFRIASYGVEMLFIPCVVLCICFCCNSDSYRKYCPYKYVLR